MTSPPSLASAVFNWDQLVARPTPVGSFRPIFDSPTGTLNKFEGHVTTLQPGETPHPPHQHPDEEFVIVKEGALEVTLNGKVTPAGVGAFIFVSSNDSHGWKNVGTTPAVYFVFRFISPSTPAA